MIDLSSEDAACVETLLFYIYNMNYDQRFLESSDHLIDFCVQMCIFADRYDMIPLKRLVETKFRLETRKAGSDAALAKASMRAYEALQPMQVIRELIVELIVKRDMMAPISVRPELELMMRQYGDLATDVVKAQRVHSLSSPIIKKGENCYRCPACQTTFVAVIEDTSATKLYCCVSCGFRAKACWWAQRIVA